MVCLGNMCMATLHKGDNDDDDDNNNNNICSHYELSVPSERAHRVTKSSTV